MQGATHGSYPLDASSIDEMLSRTSHGNYARGYMDGESFAVFCVGRSDVDVRARLHDDFGGTDQLDNDGPPAEPPHRAAESANASGER